MPKGLAHLFWQSVHAGAAAAGQEFGVEIQWNGPSQETEYSRQIQIIDAMITRRVDALAIAAADQVALVQVVDRAMAQGIPVTIFDSGLNSTNYTSFVATNNYAAGELAARQLGRLLGGKGKVAVLMHVPGSRSTVDRETAFDAVMSKEFPGIAIVARQFGMSDRARAMAAAEDMFTAHPDLDAIFASAEPSTVGASQAIKSRGLTGKIKFVGFDSSDSLIEDLKASVISALIVQDPFQIGYRAVKTLVDRLNGSTPPKRIDCDATVIFGAELEKPEVQRLLRPPIEKYLRQ
ncbi:MAG: substrate-binding domain-containing protein [Acidobacteria bacterium]|nr:substrate-binding domain-containing protein [Acidobacteriota bacterium]